MGKIDLYQEVTDRIIEKLEQGTAPWHKPFQSGGAVNWKTQKPYRGINMMLLEPGEYATFKQIQEAGGKVKKGAKSEMVIFWKMLKVEDKETQEKKKIPYMRYYRVFEINSQVEGLESKRDVVEYDHDPIEEAEGIKENYIAGPDYSWQPGRAYYRPSEDRVNVPPIKEFQDVHGFYSVLFHEMVHSTGHKDRLNRDGVTGSINFGSETYSKEELVAEMGAAFLCGVTGIENKTIDNSASYIQSWLRALKDDKTLVVKASQQAQKAADTILGVKFE